MLHPQNPGISQAGGDTPLVGDALKRGTSLEGKYFE
jgi:hypothetical protein